MLRISATSASCRKRGPSIARQSPIASHPLVGTVHNVDRRAVGPVDNQSAAGISSATMNFLLRAARWGRTLLTELASARAARLATPRWLDARLVLGILLVL